MTQKRVLLNVKRFRQEVDECAIAATSSLAHYYDPSVDYKDVRKMLPRRETKDGLFTSQQARLLNNLGFSDVSIVTCDLDIVDFSWRRYSKRKMIERLKRLRSYCRRSSTIHGSLSETVDDLVSWLETEGCNNRLIIDNNFPKYIRRSLDRGRPVGVSITVTSMFKLQKKWTMRKDSDIKGEREDHAIVLRGYDESGVFVVDSDYGYTLPRLKKYGRGYYKITWEKLLVNMPAGDLVLVG